MFGESSTADSFFLNFNDVRAVKLPKEMYSDWLLVRTLAGRDAFYPNCRASHDQGENKKSGESDGETLRS